METRMIKNVCAPAVVLGERIVIVGGESEQRMPRLDTNSASPGEKMVTNRQVVFSKPVFLKAHPSS